jgi:hypothetical protein
VPKKKRADTVTVDRESFEHLQQRARELLAIETALRDERTRADGFATACDALKKERDGLKAELNAFAERLLAVIAPSPEASRSLGLQLVELALGPRKQQAWSMLEHLRRHPLG